jgi:DNA polymerase III subunit epsilon
VRLRDLLPSRSPRYTDVVFWSLDLETEGLDPRRDAILSVGMVPVRKGVVRLREAFSSLVRPREEHAPSAGALGAHHLRPIDTRHAPELADVLPEIEKRLRGNVLLVHHAPIDVNFLRAAFRSTGRDWSPPPVVDTVRLLYRWADARRFLGNPPGDPELNLFAAREQLGLPAYPPHDALVDATATAELFLALRGRLGAGSLRQLL